MLNAIIQIIKFISAITSYRGCPTANVFTHHYELHHKNKKIYLEGFETTFTAQFGCISFHLSWFGNHSRLTPTMRNKWTSGWDGNWFYCWVPSEQKADSPSQRTYPLSSKVTKMNHLMVVPSSCGLEDANIATFVEVTSLISGCDVVEEFLASDLQPLGQQFGFQLEIKESPLSKVLVLMLQITTAIGE
jgi:hypothetical protein